MTLTRMRSPSKQDQTNREATPWPRFDARVVETQDEITVVVDGEIDVATCSRLWPVMERAISLGPRLVLDLAGTTFIGATGLTLIVRAHHRLGRRREAIVIRSLRPHARRVFSITGVDQLVTIDNPSDAARVAREHQLRSADGSAPT